METARNVYTDGSKMVIDEPLGQFRDEFKEAHERRVLAYFEKLTADGKIDVGSNRETVREIKRAEDDLKNANKKLFRAKFWRVVCGIFFFLIFTLFIIFLSLNKKIKRLSEERDNTVKEIERLKNEGFSQLKNLNSAITNGVAVKLFNETLPLVKLDTYFNSRRIAYMTDKFGYSDGDGHNASKLYVQSGDIKGNPFFIAHDLKHRLGEKTYTGSRTIHWTTTVRTKNGTSTRHHSQTLTASVTKPCPYYSEEKYLVYANEAAPDLHFSRTDSDAEILNEKQLNKLVKKGEKGIKKLAEKSVKSGGDFTALGNSEFDVLWGAFDRDDETQFRLLFTPLSQRELLLLMKDKSIGFGDDFAFIKNGKINKLTPQNLINFDLNRNKESFYGYDYEVIKAEFIKYCNEYFKHIYFTFAPLFAISVYNETVPHEYIYRKTLKSVVSFYEHEQAVNAFGEKFFAHKESGTRNILKTSAIGSGENYDNVAVTAYGYKTTKRVDYITKMGGDGHSHQVPVEWILYNPVEKTTNVTVVPETKTDAVKLELNEFDKRWSVRV